MERGLWDSSRDSQRGSRQRRARGPRERDGYRGRGRGGHTYYSNELWDEKPHGYKPLEPEPEPAAPVMPMRIQIKTRSTSPSRTADTPQPADGRTVQNKVPSVLKSSSETGEKRGGIITRRPVLQVDPENKSKIDTIAGSTQRPAHLKWLYQDDGLACHKLLDENLCWSERAADVLHSQSNYLVVGVLGRQSVGKSTVMSLLAGTRPEQVLSKSKPFAAASPACLEIASHQTYGVDMCVTSERVILLDSQPVLSTSILDRMLLQERQHGTSDNAMELYRLQSYQIAAFLCQVCHVVVLVQDHAPDADLLHLLQMSPLLQPNLGGGGADASGLGHGTGGDARPPPHLVVVRNKATAADFLLANVRAVHQVTETLLRHSRLRVHGGVSSLRAGLVLGDARHRSGPASSVNVVLLPIATAGGEQASSQRGKATSTSPMSTLLYRGHPSFAACSAAFVQQIFSIRPHKLSPTSSTISEIQWFGFAGRVWDAIRKSSLSADLNGLLGE